MYARLTRIQVDVGRVEHVTRLYERTIVPAAKAQHGFRGTYLLVNRGTGEGVAVTLWVSEEDALANERSGYYGEQIDRVKPYLVAPPVREGYEVAVHDFGIDVEEVNPIPMPPPSADTEPDSGAVSG